MKKILLALLILCNLVNVSANESKAYPPAWSCMCDYNKDLYMQLSNPNGEVIYSQILNFYNSDHECYRALNNNTQCQKVSNNPFTTKWACMCDYWNDLYSQFIDNNGNVRVSIRIGQYSSSYECINNMIVNPTCMKGSNFVMPTQPEDYFLDLTQKELFIEAINGIGFCAIIMSEESKSSCEYYTVLNNKGYPRGTGCTDNNNSQYKKGPRVNAILTIREMLKRGLCF